MAVAQWYRRWILGSVVLAALIGVCAGGTSALFLTLLSAATDAHQQHPELLFLLPLVGIPIAWAYAGIGRSAVGGSNLLINQIHATDQTNRVPLRMFPLIFVAAILTHLCGGSAGRMSSAVQMSGAIAGWLSRVLRLSTAQLRVLLMCGISSGFSSIFGTPLAGAIFGMEVLALGGMRYEALLPCLIASIVGVLIVEGLGVPHALYPINTAIPAVSVQLLLLVALAGVVFGIVSVLFVEATALVEQGMRRLPAHPVVRIFLGGCVIVAVTLVLQTQRYNGLSLSLLQDSLAGEHVPRLAFAAKLVLTALTLGVGFKGGEVTPMLVIGAALGASIAGPLGVAPGLFAALGAVAVIAGATNTPIACIIMGAEMFGTHGIIYFGVAVMIAYTISGNHGVYYAQPILTMKHFSRDALVEGRTLRDIQQARLEQYAHLRTRWRPSQPMHQRGLDVHTQVQMQLHQREERDRPHDGDEHRAEH